MKKLSLVILLLSLFATSCSEKKYSKAEVTVVEKEAGLGDGLNLQAIGTLVPKVSGPEELEKLINTSKYNNLDLDADGNIDYVNVQEYGTNFELSTKLNTGEVQSLATIEINTTTGDVGIRGDHNIYGHDHYYQRRYSTGEMLLMAYLLRPHTPYYHTPYYHGYYPGYYRSYRPVPMATYRTQTRTVTKNTTYKKSKAPAAKTKSPNSGKQSTVVKNSVANKKSSSKKLASRNKANDNKKSAWGSSNKKSTSSKSTSSSYKSKPKSSSSSWGSSSSSRKKSSSSWSSSSRSSSRSSSWGSSSRSSYRRRK